MKKTPKKQRKPRRVASKTRRLKVQSNKRQVKRSPAKPARLQGLDVKFDLLLEKFAAPRDAFYSGPNYSGFTQWLADRMNEAKFENPLLMSGMPTNEYLDFLIALPGLKDRYQKHYTKSIESGRPNLMAFNKFKLLMSIESNNDRSREVGEVVSLGILPPFESLDAETATAASLRAAFFKAIVNEDPQGAREVLGALKTKKSQHDDGEIEYFAALMYSKSGEYERAIDAAIQVDASHTDYPSARLIAAEMYAIRGSREELFPLLESEDLSEMPATLKTRLLIQLCASVDADVFLSEGFAAQLAPMLESSAVDAASPHFQSYGALLAELYLEYVKELNAFSDVYGAARQTTVAEDDTGTALDDDGFTQEISESRPRLVQLAAILGMDARLGEKLSSNSPPCDVIHYLVIERNNGIKSFEDIVIYLKACLEFYEYERALIAFKNFGGQFHHASSTTQLLLYSAVAQCAACLDERSVLEEVDRKLGQLSHTNTDTAAHLYQASQPQFLPLLTPMGRVSYKSATAALISAQNAQLEWLDAGIISLGFFRILEVELNARVVIPFLKTRGYLDSLAAYGDVTSAVPIESLTKKERDRLNRWKRLFEALNRVADAKTGGLDLGAMEVLFGFSASKQVFDLAIRAPILTALSESLTADGSAALANGGFGKPIAAPVRDRYRNPPAHARFLPVSEAEAAKRHVDQTLGLFVNWFK